MHRKEIEINRNIIEKFLMKVKDYVKEYQKQVIISSVSFLILSILVIGGFILHEQIESWDTTEFEQILNKYKTLEIDDIEEKKKELKKTVDELNRVIDSSYWGYINENGYYIIANMYLALEMNTEAKEYLLKFIEVSPSSYFAQFALHRAGILNEELGNIEEAFKIYQRLEKDYENAIITDEVFYDIGRVYQTRGEFLKAREYYNKVISLYPRSIFAEKAKNRLLLLGHLKRNKT